MKKTTLGVDLGPNSIGWSLISQDESENPCAIEAAGVRIFQEAVEAKTRTPKNLKRRAARAARRLTYRRKMRRAYLTTLLRQNGMIPDDPVELEHWRFQLDPYDLRRRGLDESLTLFEFGRSLYHLCQRRGYKSNRLTDLEEGGEIKKPRKGKVQESEEADKPDTGKSKGKKDSPKVVLEAIKRLEAQIKESGFRTLGEFLCHQPKKRCRFTARQRFVDEFEALWSAQKVFHPELLTDALNVSIFRALFWQRPLWGKPSRKFDQDRGKEDHRVSTVGWCRFELHRRRAPKASPMGQQFRILQEINNLKLTDTNTGEMRRLSREETLCLANALERQKSITWNGIRKQLKLGANFKINLEEGKKDKLTGNVTACDIRAVIGERWEAMSEATREALVNEMLHIPDADILIKRLQKEFLLTEEAATAAAKIGLVKGYLSVSRKAIAKILPLLQDGLIYSEACAAAGYEFNDTSRQTGNHPTLPKPPEARNPVVQKALWETRRVVNAVVSAYGRPDIIRIELGRDLRQGKEERQRKQKMQNQRRDDNERIQNILRNDFPIFKDRYPTRDDLLRYQLWEECKTRCPYTGNTIGSEMLFTGQVDIEHIIPYSRCWDDSYMNKTLCFHEENVHRKRNQTPYEAYSGDAERYAQVLKAVSGFPVPKREKFSWREIPEDFVERQLNDMRYISRQAKDYLKLLGCDVQTTVGRATAMLRYKWRLNTILAPDGDNEKNRADHRHHAIDAFTAAVTTRSLFKKLSDLSAAGQISIGPSDREFRPPEPWTGFKSDVQRAMGNIVVSHSVNHRLTGALHEETAYGLTSEPAKPGFVMLALRKPLSSFDKPKQLEDVRDEGIRRLMLARLKECDGDFKKAFDPEHPLLHQDGKTPINSVRVLVPARKEGLLEVSDRDGNPYKYFPLGSNHHVEILECIQDHQDSEGKKWKQGARRGVFVTTLEAARRARRARIPIIQRDHGPEWKFIAALHINDMVEAEGKDGVKRIYRVQKMSDPEIVLRLHTAATLEDDNESIRVRVHLFKFRLLQVDAIGNRKYADNQAEA